MARFSVSQKILDMLKTIGLNSYERKLYATLLAKGTSSAGTLSELSGVPRSRCYDVLESLTDKGFTIAQNTKPLKYVAVQPVEALDRLKKKHEEDVKALSDSIERAKKSEAIRELEQVYKTGVKSVEPGEMTGAIKSRHSMHQQFETVVKKASSHVNVLTTAAGLKEISENHGKLFKDANKRGLKIKIAAPINKDSEEAARALKSVADVRNTSHLDVNGRFMVADGKEFILALTHDEKTHPTQDMHLWSVSEHAAGDMLQPMFESIWKQAKAI